MEAQLIAILAGAIVIGQGLVTTLSKVWDAKVAKSSGPEKYGNWIQRVEQGHNELRNEFSKHQGYIDAKIQNIDRELGAISGSLGRVEALLLDPRRGKDGS